MKTKLPPEITTVEEAKAFLSELHSNGESFHPEDNAHDIKWNTAEVSTEEADQLNKLMEDIYNNIDFYETQFDPCEFLLSLDKN